MPSPCAVLTIFFASTSLIMMSTASGQSRSMVAKLDSSLLDVHSTENLRQVYYVVKSLSACSLLCLADYDNCAMMYYNSIDKLCQTHVAPVSPDTANSHTGGMFYGVQGDYGVCPSYLGYTRVPNISLCYKITSQSAEWQDGRDVCRNEGGDLIKLNTEAKEEFIQNQLTMMGISTSYYVGGNDIDVDTTWRWSDGTLLSDGYENWFDQEPSNNLGEHCLILPHYFDYQWNDADCDLFIQYICEIKI